MPRQPRKPDPLSPPYQSETIQQAIAGFEAALELASEGSLRIHTPAR